jgi:hypothetical protein
MRAIGRQVERASPTGPEVKALAETPAAKLLSPIGSWVARQAPEETAAVVRGGAQVLGGAENPENLAFGVLGVPELQFLAKPVAAAMIAQGGVGGAKAIKDIATGNVSKGIEEAVPAAANIMFGAAGWRAKPTSIESEVSDAPQSRIQPESSIREHPGTTLRPNIQPHPEEIRQVPSGQAGSGNRPQPVPEGTAQPDLQPGVTEANIDSLSQAKQGTLNHPDGIKYGLSKGESDVERLKSKYEEAQKQAIEAVK